MTIVTPEAWYRLYWLAWTAAVLVVVLSFAWFAGPHIVARGIALAENSK